jgi:hypothetical protein
LAAAGTTARGAALTIAIGFIFQSVRFLKNFSPAVGNFQGSHAHGLVVAGRARATLFPRELDFDRIIALAGDDPQFAISTKSCAELHLDLVRPLRHGTDRVLQSCH